MKNKNNKKSNTKILFFTLLTVALALIVALAVYFALNGDKKGSDIISTDSEVQLNTSKKTGFPFSFSGQIDTVVLSDNSVYVLTDNQLTVLSSRGNALSDTMLNFTDPMIKSSKNYAIAYDRQGSSYSLFNRKGLLFQGKTESERQIITASVSDDGKFLIASRSSEATSELTYYTNKANVIFRWLCTNEHIVSVDISSGGNNLVCAAIGSDEGKIYTKVYYFDINSSDNNKEYTFSSSSAVDCFFTSGKNAVVVCTDKRIFLKCNKEDFEPIICEYDAVIFKRSTDEKGNTAILCEKSGDVDNYLLTLYSSTNQTVFSIDVPYGVNDIACFGKKTYLLYDDKIILVNSDGEQKDIIDTESMCDYIKVNSAGVFYYTNTSLYCN